MSRFWTSSQRSGKRLRSLGAGDDSPGPTNELYGHFTSPSFGIYRSKCAKREILSYEHHSASVGTNDPASWNSASYTPDFATAIDGPLELAPNQYRERALDCLAVLKAVAFFMSTARDPRLAWVSVSIALNLYSIRGQTMAELSRQMGVNERTLTNSTARFRKLIGSNYDDRPVAPWL